MVLVSLEEVRVDDRDGSLPFNYSSLTYSLAMHDVLFRELDLSQVMVCSDDPTPHHHITRLFVRFRHTQARQGKPNVEYTNITITAGVLLHLYAIKLLLIVGRLTHALIQAISKDSGMNTFNSPKVHVF